jgi:hypothetical protein
MLLAPFNMFAPIKDIYVVLSSFMYHINMW